MRFEVVGRAVSKSWRAGSEEGEGTVGIGPVVAQGVGDVGPAVRAEQGQEEVAQRG